MKNEAVVNFMHEATSRKCVVGIHVYSGAKYVTKMDSHFTSNKNGLQLFKPEGLKYFVLIKVRIKKVLEIGDGQPRPDASLDYGL